MKLGATKKIVMASAALVAALGVAAGSTFAWFTSNTTVTVSGFDSQIVSGTESLTVAVVPSTYGDTYADYTSSNLVYGSSISSLQIKQAIFNDPTLTAESEASKNIYLSALTPKTVNGRIDGTDFKTENGADNQVITPNSEDVKAGSYISFKLIFQNRANASEEGRLPRYITLSSDSTIVSSSRASIAYNTNQYSLINRNVTARPRYYGSSLALSGVAPDQILSASSANAARVSFVRNVTTTNESGTATTSKVGRVWSPNEFNLDGSQAEYTNDTAVGTNVNRAGETNANGYYLNNLAGDFRLGSLGWDEERTVTQVAYSDYINPYGTTKEVTKITEDMTAFDNASEEYSNYTYASVIVNIWLEGTDGDCFDAILENAFSVSLTFNVVIDRSSETTETTP